MKKHLLRTISIELIVMPMWIVLVMFLAKLIANSIWEACIYISGIGGALLITIYIIDEFYIKKLNRRSKH